MIYDTQSNEIVGNNVYDLKATPKVGQTSKFDTYTAECRHGLLGGELPAISISECMSTVGQKPNRSVARSGQWLSENEPGDRHPSVQNATLIGFERTAARLNGKRPFF